MSTRGQYLVVFFYPHDFTFVRPSELVGILGKRTMKETYQSVGSYLVLEGDAEACHPLPRPVRLYH